MTDYAELRAALDQTCHALLIDDPDTIRALLAERDAFRYALEMIAGIRPCADTLMGNADIARAALTQNQGD